MFVQSEFVTQAKAVLSGGHESCGEFSFTKSSIAVMAMVLISFLLNAKAAFPGDSSFEEN